MLKSIRRSLAETVFDLRRRTELSRSTGLAIGLKGRTARTHNRPRSDKDQSNLTTARVWLGIGVLGAGILFSIPACALQLITSTEAALPSLRGLPILQRSHERGLSRAPTIIIVSPSPEAGTIDSPLRLKIKFESHGSSRINLNSVLLTYLKMPPIDLTQRVKQFIGPNGIDVEDAEVPPGTHTLRVDVSDSRGRPAWADFSFTISK